MLCIVLQLKGGLVGGGVAKDKHILNSKYYTEIMYIGLIHMMVGLH